MATLLPSKQTPRVRFPYSALMGLSSNGKTLTLLVSYEGSIPSGPTYGTFDLFYCVFGLHGAGRHLYG